MKNREIRLIEKLEQHLGGPITLSQDECLTLANTIGAILEKLELQTMALRAVSAGIWRDKKKNACGLACGSLEVDLVESALGLRKPPK